MVKGFVNKLKTPGASLKWRTIQGFVVVLFGDAYQNAVRLIGNLIMARLLYPEAFGLMLIVNLVFTALTMLSDAGIKQAIIVNGKDQGRDFLNTAWTLLVARGVILSVVACALAYPIALSYEEPILFPLILVMSLSSLIRGFSSPNEAVYDREVKKVRSVILESVSQTVGLVVAIVWLLLLPTVWALVGYGIVTSLVYTLLSYVLFEGERPQFFIDRKSAKDILRFGKWILFSTALTFMGSQGDKLIVSNWVTTAELGLFSIAIALAKVTEAVSGSICWKLLLPVYSELRHGPSGQLARQAMKVELILFVVCAPFILGMTLFGSELVGVLYDDRYFEAGWMLQVMAAGAIFTAYNETQVAMMIAHGDSYRSTLFQGCRVILLILAMLVGGVFFGLVGLVYSIAVAPALFYLVLLPNMSYYNVSPRLQVFSIMLLMAIIFSWWSHHGFPGIG